MLPDWLLGVSCYAATLLRRNGDFSSGAHRIARRRRQLARLARLFGALPGQADAQPLAARRDGIPLLAIDFEILAAERPVPGRLDHALRLRVLHQDGGLVIHPRVDAGLV